MCKILFISNIAKRVGAFSIASVEAAHELDLEFQMAAKWNATSEQIEEDQKKHNVKIHDIDLDRSPYSLRNYKAYKQLVKIICDENIDYIHCNTPVGGLLGRLAGKKCKVKKVIYQAHGFHFYQGAPKKNWLIYYPIEKWLAHYTDALITINHEDFEMAKKKFRLRKGGKIYYVPGVGINTAEYQFLDESLKVRKREELGIPLDAFVVISAGELNKNKNNSVLISAMEELKQKNLHYVLCGVGDKEKDLREQAEAAGLQNQVHFLGYRTDIKEIFAMSDCFVMPSYREGLSRSIMEAMASGLPCVVSKIRGNVDLIEDGFGGYTCPAGDVNSWAEKLGALLQDGDLCQSMATFNREQIKKYDFFVVKQKVQQIYMDVFF